MPHHGIGDYNEQLVGDCLMNITMPKINEKELQAIVNYIMTNPLR
jgi:hypothetical protein